MVGGEGEGGGGSKVGVKVGQVGDGKGVWGEARGGVGWGGGAGVL